MSELAQVVSRIRSRLQDTDRSNYVWPTTLLEDFAGEAVRRLGPVVGVRKRVEVTNDGETYDLVTIFGSRPLEVEAVLIDYHMATGWRVYGNELLVGQLSVDAFEVRGVCAYQDVTELPAVLEDAVVLESCSKALDYLLRRGGRALERYLIDQGELEANELRGLADYYHEEFLAYREEWAVGTMRGLDT